MSSRAAVYNDLHADPSFQQGDETPVLPPPNQGRIPTQTAAGGGKTQSEKGTLV